jgi:hypothetical protein
MQVRMRELMLQLMLQPTPVPACPWLWPAAMPERE